jgi:hypothetical protein
VEDDVSLDENAASSEVNDAAYEETGDDKVIAPVSDGEDVSRYLSHPRM